MHYQHCPTCGRRLTEQAAHDDGLVPYCESCRRYWFDSFSTCVISLVANEYNEIAMLRQSYLSPSHWNYVSGYITPGETAEAAARREIREELGLRVHELRFAGSYWFAPRELLMLGFIARARKAPFVLSAEVDAAEWVPFPDAPRRMHPESAGSCQQPIYRRFLELL